MSYKLYLDGELYPVTPSKITIKTENKNSTVDLLDGSSATLLKTAGLKTIEFDLLLPNVKYPFAYTNYQAKHYLDKLELLKNRKKPFRFKLLRENLAAEDMSVSLEDYSVTEEAAQGRDVTVHLSLKEYKRFGALVYEVSNAQIVAKNYQRSSGVNEPETNNREYEVKKGDTLWSIAKKYYDDGSKYTKIAEYNKIKNPALLAVGRILILP